MQGVPTGILTDIPVSGVRRPVKPDDCPNLELLLHSEPWGSALEDPDCLMELVEVGVQAGTEWIRRGKSALWRLVRGWPVGLGEEKWQPTSLDWR